MYYKLGFYLSIPLLLASCAGSNKATTKKQNLRVATGTDICAATLTNIAPRISWVAKTDDVFKGMENPVVLPKQHDVYALDTAELRSFFMTGKTIDVTTGVPLPDGIGCRIFTLKKSGAMSKELEEKYPDMVSLQGQERDTKSGDIRLDYNGKAIQAQIKMEGNTYIVKPISVGSGYYYVVYKRDESQIPVQEPAVPAKPKAPQQIKYDR